MKKSHWILAGLALLILIAERGIVGRTDAANQLLYLAALEIGYFIVVLILGIGIGNSMRRRLIERDAKEYEKSVVRYRIWAVVFVAVAITYMATGFIPGWIGRNIIFFGGYYYALAKKSKVHEDGK